MTSVYTIIVTYNGMTWIDKCLSSLVASSYPTTIIVIDNGSTDNTVEFVREKFPQARLIATGKNLGFGQANNVGLEMVLEEGAGHAFLLNQDAWVEKGTIGELVAMQTKQPQYGILSPVHLNGAGTALDGYFADYLLQSDIKPQLSAWLLDKPLDGPAVISTSFVNAAAWLISADCLRKTGGFDPIFFHYGEDVNYTQRVLFHGFKIGVDTKARICHDREIRLASTLPPAALLKRDCINFLNVVCDIRRRAYLVIILKRSMRYSFLAALNLFNKQRLTYNFHMTKASVSMIPAVKQSRKSALGVTPFLGNQKDLLSSN